MFPTALSGIRVLDLTQGIAGPFCTKLLSDFGADVVKIEPPFHGDPTRGMGPFHGDDPHPEKSGLFFRLNTNKRSITLDVDSRAALPILKGLAGQADIVVESFVPGYLGEIGLDYAALETINPAAIMTSITDFGQTGPYRDMKATDLTLFAMGGPMNCTGAAEKEPLKIAGYAVQCHAGAVAAFATVTALFQAEMEGRGQSVDVSVYETQAASRDRRVILLLAHQYTGSTGKRQRSDERRIAMGVRSCADGYVNVFGGGRWLPDLCRIMGREDLLEDPIFTDPVLIDTPEAEAIFEEAYQPWLNGHGKHEIVEMTQNARVLSAPVNTVEDVVNDPGFAERGVWEEIDHPFMGPVTTVGRPFIMGETPRQHARRAPLLGEHNDEVLCVELGMSRDGLVMLRGQGVI